MAYVSLEGCLLIGGKKTAFPTSTMATFTSVIIFMWRLRGSTTHGHMTSQKDYKSH